MLVQIQRLFEQRGDSGRAVRAPAGQLADAALGGLNALDRAIHLIRGRKVGCRPVVVHVVRRRPLVHKVPRAFDPVEIGRGLAHRVEQRRSVFFHPAVMPGVLQQVLIFAAQRLVGFVAVETDLTQALMGVGYVLEAEDGVHGVVEVGGGGGDAGPDFGVGEEGAEGGKDRVPAERVERFALLAGAADYGCGAGGGGRRAGIPPAADGGFARLAVDGEAGFDGGGAFGGGVEVAPAGLPVGGAVGPAAVFAGEEHFDGFGEARFAGAVAPGDDGEAGRGLERQLRAGADAAEGFDGDGGEVGAVRLDGFAVIGRRPLDWRAGQRFRQLAGIECGRDEEGGVVVDAVGIEPLPDFRGRGGLVACRHRGRVGVVVDLGHGAG